VFPEEEKKKSSGRDARGEREGKGKAGKRGELARAHRKRGRREIDFWRKKGGKKRKGVSKRREKEALRRRPEREKKQVYPEGEREGGEMELKKKSEHHFH